MKGLVQVYTGKGKGKTTAAMGLVLRALGHGMGVCIFQFLKKQEGSGEIEALKRFANVKIFHARGVCPLLRPPTDQEHEQSKEELECAFTESRKIIESAKYDIVILDEINVAMSKGFINPEAVLELVRKKPENVEVILTGRGAPEEILEAADIVTRMEEVKHPYCKGEKPRKGIDY